MQRLNQNPYAFDTDGAHAPPGKRLSHIGAIVEGTTDTAKEKLDLLASAGSHPCATCTEIPVTSKRLGVDGRQICD